MVRKIFVASATGIGALLWLNTVAAASVDPYPIGSTGYDYSSPQCGVAAPSAHFGIAGVNAGYPFTYYNSCLATEYAAAARTGVASSFVSIL